MTDSINGRRAQLAQILADQAALYGQVTNAVWFARQIRKHQAAGDHRQAEVAKDVAEKYGIDWKAGMRELERLPAARMTVRQAS